MFFLWIYRSWFRKFLRGVFYTFCFVSVRRYLRYLSGYLTKGKSPNPEIVLEYMYTIRVVSGPNVIRLVENIMGILFEKIYKSKGLEVELVEKALTVSFLSTIIMK